MVLRSFQEIELLLGAYRTAPPKAGPYKLDRMIQLMNYLGNPQNNYHVIHVAGTSGKSSTCYYTASLLKEAGYTVGLTVSPHVDQISERAQINMQPLDEPAYCQKFSEFMGIVEASAVEPSYFELLIAFAYWLFAEVTVDIAVVEVGLGGLLDGTNVVTRSDKVCVITDIGLDHTEVLGNSIEEITWQKAGIIGGRNTVFSYDQGAPVNDVIQKVSIAKKAHVTTIKFENILTQKLLSFLPIFQQKNFNLAKIVVEDFLESEHAKKLTSSQLTHAAKTTIPARMEVISLHEKQIILDGAHNEQKITALVTAFKVKYGSNPAALLVSFGTNKSSDVQKSLGLLRTIGSTIIVTSFTLFQDEKRTSIDGTILEDYCQKLGFKSIQVIADPLKAYRQLLRCEEQLVMITGSYHLIRHIKPFIE